MLRKRQTIPEQKADTPETRHPILKKKTANANPGKKRHPHLKNGIPENKQVADPGKLTSDP